MFAASTYDEIIEQERMIDDKHLIVFLFVKPTTSSNLDIVREFEYIHYNSGRYCSIYAIGYSNDQCKADDSTYKRVDKICNSEWFFSSKALVEFKAKLEPRIQWQYSGETELLLLQNSPGKSDPLNFQNYVSININKGLREGYIDSFQFFMESLVRCAKYDVKAIDVVDGIANQRIKIKDIIASAVSDCKKIPTPVKNIIKDRLFYKNANNFR